VGYSTYFGGSFQVKFPDKETRDEVVDLVNCMADTRRVARDMSKLKDKLDKPIEWYGTDGEFYCGDSGGSYTTDDDSILNPNVPPGDQPGVYLQWIFVPNEKDSDVEATLEADNEENFYNYIEWLEYIIERILKPRGAVMNGSVQWYGDEREDIGTITVKNNILTEKQAEIVW